MAPVPVTEDYYMVLEVQQTATSEQINRSYKRLARKVHPDRNASEDATEAFQLLGRAYATLKDECNRRTYDLKYPSIIRSRPAPQTQQTPRPPPTSNPQSAALDEEAQIFALQKSKLERSSRWATKKSALESSIFETHRDIRRLEQEITNLNGIAAAEIAEDAQKNSWSTWLLSPIYKKAEVSDEDKAVRERQRQERRIEKDMKERRLYSKKADLKKEEDLLRKGKEEVDAGHVADNRKMQVLKENIWARETRERQERERVRARIWKEQQEQQQKQERETAEALRKQQAEKRAAEQKRQEALRKQLAENRAAERKAQEAQGRILQKLYGDNSELNQNQYARHNPYEFSASEESTRQASMSICGHDGWWSKIQGPLSCPQCYDSWNYLLRCPGCEMMACPKCQAVIRPRKSRNAARVNRGDPLRARTETPEWPFYDDY